METKESYIESELYRVFKNIVIQNPSIGGVTFYDVKDRMIVGTGEADIVIFGKKGGSEIKLVIETKKKPKTYVSKLDPFSVSVIGQALGYASFLSSQFIATTNGDIFVIFDALKKAPILQSQVGEILKVTYNEDFVHRVLSAIASYLNGELGLLELSKAFIERLRYFHQLLENPTHSALEDRLSKDIKFSKRYKEWIRRQGFEDDDRTLLNIAKQRAYLLMNRILFYKSLEAYQKNLNLIPFRSMTDPQFTPEAFVFRMQQCFAYVVSNIDYQAVFKFSDILDEIPISNEVAEHLNEFIKDIESYNLSEFSRDIIGDVYQSLIPTEERKRLGQYYTPAEICDFIVKFSIRGPGDKVLDPSCGSGGFLVSAYHRLLELNNDDSAVLDVHNKVLSQIYGIDINQFATHLSAMNLTLRNLKANTNKVNLFPVDFFKIPSFQSVLSQEHERVSLEENAKEFIVFNQNFDVIVANPPYTRQDDIGDAEYVEKLREIALQIQLKVKTKNKTKTRTSTIRMSSEAGIYVYFFTHSFHFLKENGIMGFIVSNSWLDVRFGRDLQKFLLDNFKIISILDFDSRVFRDASVNTVIILLTKLSGKKNIQLRESNGVKFIRIKKKLQSKEIIDLIEHQEESFEDQFTQLTVVTQKDLKGREKWSLYLRSYPIYHKLTNNKKMCELKDIANVRVGYVTLANDFFVIPKEQAESLGIEKEYLKPSITKGKNLKNLDVLSDDLDSYMVFVNKDKNELKGSNVLEYILSGEQREIEITRGIDKGKTVTGYQNTPALKNKENEWFRLKDSGYEAVILPCLVWERWYAAENTGGLYVNHTFYWFSPKDEISTTLALALLNNSITEFMVEVHGKNVYGEGVLELTKHIFDGIPIINPNQLKPSTAKKMEYVFVQMKSAKRKGDRQRYLEIKGELDQLLFDELGLNMIDRQELYQALENARNLRRNKVKSATIID